MTKLIPILILLFLTTCQGVDKHKDSNKNITSDSILIKKPTTVPNSGIQRNTDLSYKPDSSLFCKIDTLELKAFWNKFIKAVKTKNKQVISESLSFDFALHLGELIVEPYYMKNCNGIVNNKSIDDYGILLLTEKNFDQFFDTIFTKDFIKLISGIKIDSIMKNGMNTRYSYVYSYKPSLKDFPCSHEKVVVINLFYCREYRITIGFCC